LFLAITGLDISIKTTYHHAYKIMLWKLIHALPCGVIPLSDELAYVVHATPEVGVFVHLLYRH